MAQGCSRMLMVIFRGLFVLSVIIEVRSSIQGARGCCHGQILHVLMPTWDEAPYIRWDGTWSNETNHKPEAYTGFLPEVLDEIAKYMGAELIWVTSGSHGVGPYDAPRWDLGLSWAYLDNAMPASQYTMSLPLLTVRYGALVHKVTRTRGFWGIFDPFTLALWMVCLATLCLLAACFVTKNALMQGSRREMLRELRPSMFLHAMYHIMGALFGGDDYDWQSSWSGRILRMALLFFVFIFGATYTANLVSMLTRIDTRELGPKSLQDLRHSKVCSTWFQNDAVRVMGGYVGEIHAAYDMDFTTGKITGPSQQWDLERAQDWCVRALISGRLDAWVAEKTVLQQHLTSNCDDFAMVTDIDFHPMYTLLLGHQGNGSLYRNVNSAIMNFLHSKTYSNLEEQYLGKGQVCPPSEVDEAEGVIDVGMMGGMFIITAVLACLAFAIAVASWVKPRRSSDDPKDVGDAVEPPPVHHVSQLEDLALLTDLKQRAANPQLQASMPEARWVVDEPSVSKAMVAKSVSHFSL